MPAAAPRRPATSGAPLRDLPPLDPPGRRRSSLAARIFIGLVSLVFVVAVVVALVLLTGSNSSNKSSPTTQTSNAPALRRTAAFSPASVTVAVLNGTATNQLAHHVAAKLGTSGYKQGRIATATNQTEPKTTVAYLPGSQNRTDALHVATALDLKPSAVQPIDPTTKQVACPPPGACTANVVVTVGADLATLS
jgi:LytR cell envelope-related transcriptional attenuator